MTETLIRIATRKSPLALWQAEHVASRLKQIHPTVTTELVQMSTQGDRVLDSPLAKIGGKGLFVKELEEGMLRGEADIAVHSMKDVSVDFPPGLHLSVILPREDPRDAFVSLKYSRLYELPTNARIGTSSLRRQCQLMSQFPDCKILPLRGNVNTRLRKLDSGNFDAIILASAGLKRLGFETRINEILEPEVSLPAIGQGAIGIECRADDEPINTLLQPLHDETTGLCVYAERAMNARLQGGCQVPIAGFAEIEGGHLLLRGLVGHPQGKPMMRSAKAGDSDQYQEIGVTVAEDLLSQGADKILAELYQ